MSAEEIREELLTAARQRFGPEAVVELGHEIETAAQHLAALADHPLPQGTPPSYWTDDLEPPPGVLAERASTERAATEREAR